MTGRLLHAWYILPLASLALYGYTRVNVIHVGNNYLETLIWTFRSWRLNQPVSQDLLEWAHPEDDDDDDEYMRRALRAMGAWKFLSPFFASRGYTLYTRGIATILTPPPTPPPAVAQDYPFARLLGTPVDYDWEANRVWPARDRLGRDVVIKLIANSKQSPELEALQRLNSPSARLDSRNNTIPILEYLHWGTLVFAVMPRWFSAFNVDFEHLGEAVHLWEQLLEGLEFCHEHRVAHCDILEQNIVLDVLIPERTIGTLKNVTGSESRFAFIDFGLATVIPYTMALEDAPLRTDIIFERRAGLGSRRPCNPFVVDVMSIGSLMQRLIRLASDVFPEGDHLLDKMMGLTSESIPTATEALVELRAIKARLSEDTLQFYLPGMIWRKQGDGYYIVPRP